ncbi:MAG: HNH endonuclease family protein [Marmoricola sp.]
MKRPSLAAVLTLLVSAALLTSAPSASATVTYLAKAENGQTVTMSVRTAVGRLMVAGENRYGYQRTLFKHWIDIDRDCQDTRAEVLRSESTKPTNSGCVIRYGRWLSAYDGKVLTHASEVQIDHVVPLAEAWDSGARTWSNGRREAFANDLTDPRSLAAVSASSNESKSDQDPAEWLPSQHVCTYVRNWVIVKLRWSLAVDPTERALLVRAATRCPQMVFTTHKAKVVLVSYGSSSSGGTSTGGTSGGSGLDPRYSTCTEAKAHGYGPYVQGRDPTATTTASIASSPCARDRVGA